MELKDVLGEIEADSANLVHGRLLEWALTPPLWHAEAVGGCPHHHARLVHTRRGAARQRPMQGGALHHRAFCVNFWIESLPGSLLMRSKRALTNSEPPMSGFSTGSPSRTGSPHEPPAQQPCKTPTACAGS